MDAATNMQEHKKGDTALTDDPRCHLWKESSRLSVVGVEPTWARRAANALNDPRWVLYRQI